MVFLKENLMIGTHLPQLDDMLHPLLVEEGKHQFAGEAHEIQAMRHHLFPITRSSIYFNHASNGPLPLPVADVLHDYIEDTSLYGNLHYQRWTEYGQNARQCLARLINARPDQIAFTANTGDGLTTIAQGLRWQRGDTIVSAAGEFPTNVYPWLNLHEYGVWLHTVVADDHRVLVEDVLGSITERTRLVSLGLVEFSTGFRNDIASIAQYCHEREILCGIDAMQALGALDIDVVKLGVDYMVAASHKWMLGPQICGILYVSDNLLAQLSVPRRGWQSVAEPFDFFNHAQPLKAGAVRFEYNTPNALPIVGLGASLDLFEHVHGGMQAVEARILGLTAHAIAGLERLGYPVVSPQGAGERSGIVCFKPHSERQELTVQHIVDQLAARNIYTAARSSVVRISPHFYNTIEEIDLLLNALEEMR